MPDAKKGDLVQIHKVILKPGQRPDTLPECTRSVLYEGWVKGFLISESANIGDEVKIETFIGREISGILEQVNPVYDHNFGVPQKELLSIGSESWKKLEKMGNRS
jgi:hypothetical protein